MKKIISILSIFVVTTALLSAQVLPKQGVENTLSTTLGLPYGESGNDHREGFHFYGFIDTLQIRVDISKFTVEGMLNWGALTSWKYSAGSILNIDDDGWGLAGFTFANTSLTPFTYTNDWRQGSAQTNGYADSYYVNFLFHPVKNFDFGLGTRLNWVIGPAPGYGAMLWEPLAHIVQGGLKDAVPGGADAAGYIKYANYYARTALAARFKNDMIEAGVSIPSGATTDYFLTNFAFGIAPVDWIYVGMAFEGIWKGDSNFYTGMELNFKNNFMLDVYLAIDNIGGNNDNGMWGTGAALLIKFPKINFSIRPEVGFTFWNNSNYTLAWYTGLKAEIEVNKFTFGAWTSLAWGSANKDWYNNDATKSYTGGFVFDLRPDLTFAINKNHSISAMFDIQFRHAYDNKKYNTWATAIYWTYKL